MKEVNLIDWIPPEIYENINDLACVYNGIDVIATAELFLALSEAYDLEEASGNTTLKNIYRMEVKASEVAFAMMTRGIHVDTDKVKDIHLEIEETEKRLSAEIIDCLAKNFTARPKFNWRSPLQLKEVLYDEMFLGLKGYRRKKTTEKDVLENMLSQTEQYIPRLILKSIVELKSLQGDSKVIKRQLSEDILKSINETVLTGSYNVAGTKTGRWSSSKDPFGKGGNMQNITRTIRRIFRPSKGMQFLQLDMKQAESIGTGALCFSLTGKDTYLSACETSDVHTQVAMYMNPSLKSRKDAETIEIIKGIPYRQLAKSVQHGSNYWGSPQGIAFATKLPVKIIKKAQELYFGAFPEILESRNYFKDKIQKQGFYETFFPRRLPIHLNLAEYETAKIYYAYVNQSFIADCATSGIIKIWESNLPCYILAHTHDGVLMEIKENHFEDVAKQAKELMRVTREVPNERALETSTQKLRKIHIEIEAMKGYSWHKNEMTELT